MALIYCPECNKEISDKAKSCPRCGYPISGRSAVMQQAQGYASQCIITTREIASECTAKDAIGCLSLIVCISGSIAILTIIIMSVIGYHFIGMFGLACAIGVLITKLNKNI